MNNPMIETESNNNASGKSATEESVHGQAAAEKSAVIKTGGTQYLVAVGDRVKVEKLTAETGDNVDLGGALMVANDAAITVGKAAADTTVSAKVLGHGRANKIKVFKMKRRKGYRRTLGHRQHYTEIEITAIS